MTRFKLSLVTTIVSAFLTVPALANDYYIGAQTSHNNTDPVDLQSLSLIGGFMATEQLSFEARFGLGVNENSEQFMYFERVISNDFKIDKQFGFYSKYQFSPSNSALQAYGLLGYTYLGINASSNVRFPDGELLHAGSARETRSDFSYGGGISFDFSQNYQVSLEYMNILDLGDVKVDGISLGFTARL